MQIIKETIALKGIKNVDRVTFEVVAIETCSMTNDVGCLCDQKHWASVVDTFLWLDRHF